MAPRLTQTKQRQMVQAAHEYLQRVENGDFITIKELANQKELNEISLQRYIALIRENKPLPSLEQPQGGQNKCISDVVEEALAQFLLRMQEGAIWAPILAASIGLLFLTKISGCR
jgi:hypothetical protein